MDPNGIGQHINLLQIGDCEEQILQGIDSQVGVINCGKNTFNYDYGLYGYKGPRSLLDNFNQTFKGYHYSAFFRDIGMDEKAWKSLISQVKIINVIPKATFEERTIKECEPCNAVAILEFENKLFNFPFTDNADLVADDAKFQFSYVQENGWTYKRYKSLDKNGACGLYIFPTLKDLTQNNLSIVATNTSNKEDSFILLKKIRMNTNLDKNIE